MKKAVNKAENRKKDIIETSKQFFITQGYERTTIEAIISAMGVSKGMFYHHYKSKEALFEDVLDDLAFSITEQVVHILTDKSRNAKQKLQDLYVWKREMLHQMIGKENKLESSFWVSFYNNISKKCLEIISPHIRNVILEGAKEGYFKVQHPKMTAALFTGMYVSSSIMLKEYFELYDDVDEAMEAGKEIVGRLLGCDFNE